MDKEDKTTTGLDDNSNAGEGQRRGRRTNNREGNRKPDERREREQSEWEEKIIQVRRVTKVV